MSVLVREDVRVDCAGGLLRRTAVSNHVTRSIPRSVPAKLAPLSASPQSSLTHSLHGRDELFSYSKKQPVANRERLIGAAVASSSHDGEQEVPRWLLLVAIAVAVFTFIVGMGLLANGMAPIETPSQSVTLSVDPE